MLRITELRLPLNHADGALREAVLARLGIADTELKALKVFKRSFDARKKSAVVLIYTVDIEVSDDAVLLARWAADLHVKCAPDMRYRFVAHAPADFHAPQRPRPVVVDRKSVV